MNLPTDIEDILGLNVHEKAVLRAVSKMAISPSLISKRANVPRSSILYMLRKMEARGLVVSIMHGKYRRWRGNMARLTRYLQTFHERMEPEVVIYRGTYEIISIFEKLIDLPKNSRVSGMQPDKSIRYALRKNKLEDFIRINEGMKNKSLIFEGIVHEKSVDSVVEVLGKSDAKKIFDSFIGRLEDYVKIPDEFANVESEIYFFDGSVYIINWSKEIAIGINNKDMVGLILAMFSCVKELGTRYSQNSKMKKYNKVFTPPDKPR